MHVKVCPVEDLLFRREAQVNDVVVLAGQQALQDIFALAVHHVLRGRSQHCQRLHHPSAVCVGGVRVLACAASTPAAQPYPRLQQA